MSIPTTIAIVLSELFAARLVWKLWHSEEAMFFKLSITAIAIIPVLGPIIALWLSDFPEQAPEALQDKYKYSSDVHDRWEDVIREKNPVSKFKKWKKLMKQ